MSSVAMFRPSQAGSSSRQNFASIPNSYMLWIKQQML